jgi:hypothetical protein
MGCGHVDRYGLHPGRDKHSVGVAVVKRLHVTMADTVPRNDDEPGAQGGAWLVACRECDWQRMGAYTRGTEREVQALSLAHSLGTAHETRYNARNGVRR